MPILHVGICCAETDRVTKFHKVALQSGQAFIDFVNKTGKIYNFLKCSPFGDRKPLEF